ncbi:WLM-domain-containing protein [Macrolepiota fuliginosa MF-IS2]|uniref:WLM-domain-containing protein n=1 Tax=Macrolepiota fuliginosa MF-IS2 TaxID=1400762 RepID=A0A9P6C295_9AGAR|nr:WLM-domain-containing protein [Macrolepiota fuliginosa MF-IS2]
MVENLVLSFEHLEVRPHADQALGILQRVASLLKPIMRKHGWKLPVLAEFFPDNPSLQDIGQGEKICLRLRPARAADTFREETELLDTMLHELTHNVHGSHDEAFWKFHAQLQNEYEVLRHSGYAGEGFFAPGRRLGVGVSHNIPVHQVRLGALDAAEKRIQKTEIMGSGGGLGGWKAPGFTPRELSARAAERRAQEERGCGNSDVGAQSLAIKEARKARAESASTGAAGLQNGGVITTAIIGPKDQVKWACPSCTLINSASQRNCKLCETRQPDQEPGEPSRSSYASSSKIRNPPQQDQSTLAGPQNNPRPDSWKCSVCTLLNEFSFLQCAICMTRRPFDQSSTWVCLACDASGNLHDFWSCRKCGAIKPFS